MKINHVNRKIILFGTGNAASCVTALLEYGLDMQVDFYLDNNSAKWGTLFCGRIVRSPSEILGKNPDTLLVIIASSFHAEITAQLNHMGLHEHVHFWSAETLFSLPYCGLFPEVEVNTRKEYLRLYGKLDTLLDCGMHDFALFMIARHTQWVTYDDRNAFLPAYFAARTGNEAKARDILTNIAAGDHPWRETAERLCRECDEDSDNLAFIKKLDKFIGFDEYRHQQLLWMTGLLEAKGILSWADSGTLLGLMRANRILRHDHDIDLASWHDDLAGYEDLEATFIAAGYNIFKEKYRGEVFKYSIRPLMQETPNLPININLFRIAKGHAWCPFKVRCPGATARPFVSDAARNIIDLNDPLLADQFDIMTWWVPENYFSAFTLHPMIPVWIPTEWAGYLDYKYGQWRTPNVEWNTLRDDGCLNHKQPEEILRW